MKIENVFEAINPTAIRIKGTRVGIEIVIEQFLKGATQGKSNDFIRI